jgi:solute carrier family 25 carnitine/acylcarnitine transporter 20/29
MPSVFESIFAGSLSGMAATLACHPFDVIRTNIQLYPSQPVLSVINTTMKGGIGSLYKGLLGPFLAQAVYKSIIFGSYNASARHLFSGSGPLSVFMNGFIAGTINSLIVSPVEIVRTRQIFAGPDKSNNFKDVVIDIYRRGGWKGFYIGIIPTLIRDGPGMGLYMLSFDLCKKYLIKAYPAQVHDIHVPIWIRLVAGSVAGITFWTWALPIDTLKTLIESSFTKSFSFSAAFTQFRSNLHTLYRALPVAYLRGVPSAAVTLTVYELVIEELAKGKLK